MSLEDHDILIEIRRDVLYIKERMNNFVSYQEFLSVKLISYGLAGTVFMFVVGKILETALAAG